MLWMFVVVWPLIGLMIVSAGWIEDLAAKRSPRLWPNGAKRPARRVAEVPRGGSHRS